MMSKVVAAVVLVSGLALACNSDKTSADMGHEGHDASMHAKAQAAQTSGSQQEMTEQKTCPVMGGGIDKSIYVDYQGQRVYFCCNACPSTFKQDPEKYLQVLKDRGESVEKLKG